MKRTFDKALVVGGSGFLGNQIIEELKIRNYKVFNYDISDGRDILHDENLDNFMKETKPNIVYHLAALSDMDGDDAMKMFSTNINGTVNVLNKCRKYDIDRFVFASTIYVYSDKGSFYRISKQTCESLIEEYNKLYGIQYTILRYGSLYGPKSNYHNWIRIAIEQALKERKITRYGDGEEIREYIHIEDAARLSVDILDELYINKILTITGNHSYRIRDVMEMIKEIIDESIELEFKESVNDVHYKITPYKFNPKSSTKLTSIEYRDLGQGILECINEIYEDSLS